MSDGAMETQSVLTRLGLACLPTVVKVGLPVAVRLLRLVHPSIPSHRGPADTALRDAVERALVVELAKTFFPVSADLLAALTRRRDGRGTTRVYLLEASSITLTRRIASLGTPPWLTPHQVADRLGPGVVHVWDADAGVPIVRADNRLFIGTYPIGTDSTNAIWLELEWDDPRAEPYRLQLKHLREMARAV